MYAWALSWPRSSSPSCPSACTRPGKEHASKRLDFWMFYVFAAAYAGLNA